MREFSLLLLGWKMRRLEKKGLNEKKKSLQKENSVYLRIMRLHLRNLSGAGKKNMKKKTT